MCRRAADLAAHPRRQFARKRAQGDCFPCTGVGSACLSAARAIDSIVEEQFVVLHEEHLCAPPNYFCDRTLEVSGRGDFAANDRAADKIADAVLPRNSSDRAGYGRHVLALRVAALAFVVRRRVLGAGLLETVVAAVLRAGFHRARAAIVRAFGERP